MLLQALRVEIEMKHLNLQATFLVKKVVGTRSHVFPPHYTPGCSHSCWCFLLLHFQRFIKMMYVFFRNNYIVS